jgi:hypothetical protein
MLLNFGEPGGFDITPWADRVQLIDAKSSSPWELPALGAGFARTELGRRIAEYMVGTDYLG